MLLLNPTYELKPRGESSRAFLRLMQEAFDSQAMLELWSRGQALEKQAELQSWRKDLMQWPPENPQRFGQVAFFRMFASSTQRGQHKTDRPPTPEETQRERLVWIQAHLLVQDWVAKGLHPNISRIQELNAFFGHSVRQQSLHERFRCFDVIDLNEALDYFDTWYQDLCQQKVWPIQKATLVAAYLLAVHPFDNGNGRTARLVLDWILNLYGLPPVCFLNRYHALLARSPSPWDTIHPLALKRVIEGMENTLKLCRGEDILIGEIHA